MCCEVGNGVAKLAKWFAKLAKWFAKLAMGCEFGNGFAKLAKWFAKLAMRNFAKLLKFLCEKRSSQMHSECV